MLVVTLACNFPVVSLPFFGLTETPTREGILQDILAFFDQVLKMIP